MIYKFLLQHFKYKASD